MCHEVKEGVGNKLNGSKWQWGLKERERKNMHYVKKVKTQIFCGIYNLRSAKSAQVENNRTSHFEAVCIKLLV